jgi:hypothetical protein
MAGVDACIWRPLPCAFCDSEKVTTPRTGEGHSGFWHERENTNMAKTQIVDAAFPFTFSLFIVEVSLTAIRGIVVKLS